MQCRILYLVFFLSGISGLAYEILWTRMLAAGLGHEIVAMLAVVSSFFSGFALGAWFLDKPVSRSQDPAIWYVLLETMIGLWSLVLIFALPITNDWAADFIGISPSPLRHWFISFLYPFAVLLPATFAMGGTLPTMDRLIERMNNDGMAVAGLYSVNTFGAVAGTFIITFLILPRTGMNEAAYALSLLNLSIAAIIYLLACRNKTKIYPQKSHLPQRNQASQRLYGVLFITGLLGIGFEVLMTRVFSQVLENTVYSFATILMVYLTGTALGAWSYQRHKPFKPTPELLSNLLLLTSFSCGASIALLQYMLPLHELIRGFWGNQYRGSIAAEVTLGTLFLLIPTMCMGATFSHIAQSLKCRDQGVGRALCLNTIGGAVAPLLFGVVLVPVIGIMKSLLLIPMAYIFCLKKFQRMHITGATIIMALVFTLGFGTHPYQFLSLSEGDSVVSHQEGVMASVTVIEDARQELHLKVNNHFQMGGTTSIYSDRRQAYLPLLLHPAPQRALFLGLGSGITFAAASEFPDLKADGVELIPEVIQALDSFKMVTGDFNTYKNLHIINTDARRYVSATKQQYDVIIADLFHPARDGAGSLYTLEHFSAIRTSLAQNGLFCQWLPLYQLNLDTLKTITRTFLEVFPEGQAFLAHYSLEQPIIGLVGSRQKLRFPEEWYKKRVRDSALQQKLSSFGYDSIYSILGTFVAGGEKLLQYAGSHPVNTDTHPIVLFQVPHFVYEQPAPPSDRLIELLGNLPAPAPDDILALTKSDAERAISNRLEAYWAARNRFLELGTQVARTRDVVKLYQNASEPLLSVVRKSADFSAAYLPLISIAYNLYPHDAAASYKLLLDLEAANRSRPEAGLLRQRLFHQ